MVNKSLIYIIIVLKLCILFCYWVFFPQTKFNTNESQTFNTNESQAFGDLEKSLCEYGEVEKKVVPSKECPRNGIVTAMQGGRLGNQIWEYASVWVVAKETGLRPYVPKCMKSRIEVLFENLSIPTIEEIRHCPMGDTISIKYIENYVNNNNNTLSIILQRYNTQPELLGKYFQNFKHEFKIKTNFLNESQKMLHSFKKLSNKTVDCFIGVHVRRTDYVEFVTRRFHANSSADINFYKSAISHFEKKYKNSIFVVVTDEPEWCKEKFKSLSDVFIASSSKSSPELDLAILASCNHSIIDYGTFGEWGALLAGGETIFFKVNPDYFSERLSRVFPTWSTL